jgi:hypothetical protein
MGWQHVAEWWQLIVTIVWCDPPAVVVGGSS